MIDCVNADAVANVATEYSAAEFNLADGTWTFILLPPDKDSTNVSSPSSTRSVSSNEPAIASTFPTKSRSNSLPSILDLFPPTDAVFNAFSIPSKFTATVLLTSWTIFCIAGFLNGLSASIGT